MADDLVPVDGADLEALRTAYRADQDRLLVQRMPITAAIYLVIAMRISGHWTRSVFDRYNIVSEDDLATAAAKVSEYVAARAAEGPRVVPLPIAFTTNTDKNTDNRRKRRSVGRAKSVTFQVARDGIEPSTLRFSVACSTN
jgi:hypothetical protein